MYKTPSLTVDAVVISENEDIVLINRRNDPYKHFWALPGGFVEYGETVESAIIREVKEETGLDVELNSIVGVYSEPERDPRGHTITICYIARESGGKLKADTDASDAQYFHKNEVLRLKLAFDHEIIIKDAYKLLYR